ncbi:MAG: nucleotidyltransferase domain-containing protein [Rhizomicrobium sp.]
MTTPAQQSLIDAITRVLSADGRIESAWLTGSLGKGAGDEFSDVDVTVVVPDASFDDALRHYSGDLSMVANVVRINIVSGRVLNAITDLWARFDLTFVKPNEFAVMPLAAARPLFNRGTPERTFPAPPPYKTTAPRVLQLSNEFIRVIGLTPVGIGREEFTILQEGVGLLRRMTLDLMLEANGIGPQARGGALHMNLFLTQEQRRALESVPPVGATRESVIAADIALARIFLPLAKKLAAETGAPWPSLFEDATRAHLARTLGAQI